MNINMSKISNNSIFEEFNHSKVHGTLKNETVKNGRDMFLVQYEIAVQAIIFAVAVLGNSTVLIALFRMKKNLTRMHRLMAHLATADLFVAFGSLFPQLMWDIIYPFQGGEFLCKVVKYLQVANIYAASYILVVTAIDRFIAICYPFLSHTWPNRRTDQMVGIAWILSLLLSIPQMIIFSMRWTQHSTFDCWALFKPEWTATLYVTVFTFLVYIFPTLILGYCYVRICVAVWSSGRVGFQLGQVTRNEGNLMPINTSSSSITNYESEKESIASRTVAGLNVTGKPKHRKVNERKNSPQRNRISAAKLKTIKLTMTVVCCYFICWSPFFIAQLWAAYDGNPPIKGPAFTILMLLAHLNSCTNPWIYLAFTYSPCAGLYRCLWKRKLPSNNRSLTQTYELQNTEVECIK